MLFGFIVVNKAHSQDLTTIETDTINIKEIKPRNNKYFDPDRAALLSAVVPGLGQIYNKKYWKLPFVYGGVFALYYFFNQNNDKFKSFRNARINLQNPQANLEIYAEHESIDRLIITRNPSEAAAALERGEANFRRNRDLTIILACASYGLIIVDAYVDAHLKGFKISKDLSFKPKPSIQPTLGSSAAVGIAFNLKFNNQ